MKKRISFFCIWILMSCFKFANPVDPNSPNYVGVPIEIGVNLSELTSSDYGELYYPALSWTAVPDSTYYLSLSKNEDFSFHSDDYQAVFPSNRLTDSQTFTFQNGWFLLYNSSYLDRLGAGTYHVRVSVANSTTGYRFLTWSRPSRFTQKLKQIRSGWDDGSQYSVYSYTNDGLFKKEDIYYRLQSSTDTIAEERYLETVVYGYRENGMLRYELIYDDPEALPSHYSFHYYYDIEYGSDGSQAEKNFLRIRCYYCDNLDEPEVTARTAWENTEQRNYRNGKIENIEYYSLKSGRASEEFPEMSDEEFMLSFFYLSKERIYNYDSAGNPLSIRENHYRQNADNDKQTLISYFIYSVKGNAVYRGESYDAGGALLYTYEVEYYDADYRYPFRAVYKYENGTEQPSYLYSYNFTTPDPETETAQTSSSSDDNSENQYKTDLGRSSSDQYDPDGSSRIKPLYTLVF